MSDKYTIIISILALIGGYVWRRRAVSVIAGAEKPTKGQKRNRTLATLVTVIGGYLLLTKLIELVFGPQE
ncbi:hypothetical protein AAFA46_09720, partial [Oscillospiraceae bacterium WX1]